MTEEQIVKILNKAFNSPLLIASDFPGIEKVEVIDVTERLSHPKNYIVNVEVYTDIKIETVLPFIKDLLFGKMKYIMKLFGIGGDRNFIHIEFKK